MFCFARLKHNKEKSMVQKEVVRSAFSKMGARVKFEPEENRFGTAPAVSLDVQRDREGEHFQLRLDEKVDSVTIAADDVRVGERHLLLTVKNGDEKTKFLCGHDERQWFAAPVAEVGVNTVAAAKESLKPEAVKEVQNRKKVKSKHKGKRKTVAYLRQGEFFFIPESNVKVSGDLILRKEPLQRGAGSKPHVVEFAYRTGGTVVWVSGSNVLSQKEYSELDVRQRRAYSQRMSNATVYVKGKVRHPDHKTLNLRCWHRVEMSTEQRPTGRSVRLDFID